MDDLTGHWRLAAAQAQWGDGTEAPPALGPHPMGLVEYAPTGRVLFSIADGDPAVPPLAGRVFISFVGTCRFDGTTLRIAVDASSGPKVQREQAFVIEFDGPDRHTAVPLPSKSGARSGVRFTWERMR